MSEIRPGEKEAKISKKSQLTLELVGAAIFGALSIVVGAYITPLIPRIPAWEIAIVDPISIIWIICLLIFVILQSVFFSKLRRCLINFLLKNLIEV